jgi:D-3-phosphoglycerate dehydrogenase / 2-oxoglutarate reductase
MTFRVVVTDYTFPNLAQEEAAARGAGAEFSAHQCRTAQEVAAAVKDADVALVQFAPFTAEAASNVKPGGTVIRYGVGYDNIDVGAARSNRLQVGYVPDYCTDEVADHAAALALSLLRKLTPLDASVRRGEWAAVSCAKPIKPFSETNFGFFGLGQIGRALLTRLSGFGFRFLATDPALSPADAERLNIKPVDAGALLRESDILSLHAPATGALAGYFNRSRLASMRPHAMIVNCARGQLIVEDDLAEALRANALGGAGLDVFTSEPLPADSTLRDAPNLIVTPHAAWYSDVAIERLQALAANDITRALRGDAPRRPVQG